MDRMGRTASILGVVMVKEKIMHDLIMLLIFILLAVEV